MARQHPHAVEALTPSRMLLIMLQEGSDASSVR